MSETTETGLIIPHQGNEMGVRPLPGSLGKFDENVHDWNQLEAEAVGLGGAELLGKELVDYMEKVPHIIASVAFYQGKMMANGHDGAFVACTAVIAPEDILSKRFRGNDLAKRWEDLPFFPDDVVVYNDGSTGMYRQIVKVLHEKGYITFGDEAVIEGGGSGESTYDFHPAKWAGIDSDRCRMLPRKEDGGFGGVEFNLRISAPRGIRYSTYDGPAGEAKTRYIA